MFIVSLDAKRALVTKFNINMLLFHQKNTKYNNKGFTMRQEDVMCDFFGFSPPTYYKRKREGNLAIEMIEKYFKKYEIQEYINHNKILKLEFLQQINLKSEIEKKIENTLKNFSTSHNIESIYTIISQCQTISKHQKNEFNRTNCFKIINDIENEKLLHLQEDKYVFIAIIGSISEIEFDLIISNFA